MPRYTVISKLWCSVFWERKIPLVFKGGGFWHNNIYFLEITRYQYMFLPVLLFVYLWTCMYMYSKVSVSECWHKWTMNWMCVFVYIYTLKKVFHLVCVCTNVCLSMWMFFWCLKKDSWAAVHRIFRVQEGYQSFQLHDEMLRNWDCVHAHKCGRACMSFLCS